MVLPRPRIIYKRFDLSQVKNMLLYNTIFANPLILNNAKITMRFSIFKSILGTQKHATIFTQSKNKSTG